MSRSWSVRAVVLLALTAVPLSAFTGTAGAAAHAAVDTEQFCDAASEAYVGSGKVDKNGAFTDPAAMAASARASAPYAPAKVRAAASSIAKVYADVAKVSGSQAQAQRYGTLYAKVAKPIKVYYGYYGKTCGGTGATSGAGNSSGSGNLTVNLTIAAAGALPETKITGTKSLSECSVKSTTVYGFVIDDAEVTGLSPGDTIGFTTGGGGFRMSIGGVTGYDTLGSDTDRAAFVEISDASAGAKTIKWNALPIRLGDTATTLSGTVTCPKSL